MKLRMLIGSICTVIVLMMTTAVYSQDYRISIRKERSDKEQGFYLRIKIEYKNIVFDSKVDKYEYENVTKLPDSIKFYIIGQLLEHSKDTSRCSNKVFSYPNAQFDGCFYLAPSSKYFNIGIESLFIINRIAYFKYINKLSCFPVLFDSRSHQEANSDFSILLKMDERYHQWFDKCKSERKFLVDYKYLNAGRIKWWGNHL